MTHLNYTIILITWQSWLFSAAVLVVCAVAAFMFCKINSKKFIHENNMLQQRIVEYKELLEYAKQNEQKAKEDVEVANRSKGFLLAKLSHEIRTPMNGVIGMASLLSETELSDEQKEYTDTIIKSSEKLMTSINDMLVADVITYTESGTARTQLEEKDYNLRNAIEDVLESFAGKAAQNEVELIYLMDNGVPEMLIGNEVRLKQILMNLVENALRFTMNGEIFISVQMLRLLEGNQVDLAFEVRDTGTGMPAKEIELLSKDISDINTSNEGNALSLIISKKLVTLMGGKLEIENKQGPASGTIIKFKQRVRTSLQPHRAPVKFNTAAKNKNILLVDDNYTSQTILKQQLEQWNLSPSVASSAKEAIDILNSNNHIDILITDMEMPRMNGIALAEAVKKINPKISIMLLNTTFDEQYKNHAGLFKSVLTKPVKHHLMYKNLARELTTIDVTEEIQSSSKPRLLSDTAEQFPLSILVAEDNKTNQDVALKVLKKLGYEAALAENGEEALEMVSEGQYDIIFMDVQMPVKDGLEATRMIRLCLNTQPVIIAMTANAIDGDRQKCLNAGMDDYMSKPFKIEELTRMIEKWARQIKVK